MASTKTITVVAGFRNRQRPSDTASIDRLSWPADINTQCGLDLFTGKAKCADCHAVTPNAEDLKRLFTETSDDALGIPRNPANPIDASAWINEKGQDWVEPGLGGFLRTQDSYREEAISLIGNFQVPILRNGARKPNSGFVRRFMHNGYFNSLDQVGYYYNNRDRKPHCANPQTPVKQAVEQGCWPAPEVSDTVNRTELDNFGLIKTERRDQMTVLETRSDPPL